MSTAHVFQAFSWAFSVSSSLFLEQMSGVEWVARQRFRLHLALRVPLSLQFGRKICRGQCMDFIVPEPP